MVCGLAWAPGQHSSRACSAPGGLGTCLVGKLLGEARQVRHSHAISAGLCGLAALLGRLGGLDCRHSQVPGSLRCSDFDSAAGLDAALPGALAQRGEPARAGHTLRRAALGPNTRPVRGAAAQLLHILSERE